MAQPVVRFDVIGEGSGGQEIVSTFHYRGSDGTTWDATQLGFMCNDFESQLSVVWLPCMPLVAWTWRKTVATYMAHVPPIGVESFALDGTPGSENHGCDHVERAFVLKRHTAFSGRAYRGRLFVPMPPAGMFDIGGTLDVGHAQIGLFETLRDWIPTTLYLDVGGSSQYVDPCIYHRGSASSTQITDCSFNHLVGVQRRRRVGIGS